MAEKSKTKTQRITTVAVMAAIIFVMTWLVKFPLPISGGAYLNLGDTIIYICAYILGGPLTALAAAIGSGLADLAVGSLVYVVPTIIIKALMGLAAGYITKKQNFPFYLLACAVGGAIMTGGYAVFEALFFDTSYALAAMPFNLIQWAGCVIIAAIFYSVAKQISTHYKFREQ
jgi:uncharacterized membrane protein